MASVRANPLPGLTVRGFAWRPRRRGRAWELGKDPEKNGRQAWNLRNFGAPIAALLRPAYVPSRRRAQAAPAGAEPCPQPGYSAAESILARSPYMNDVPIELTENAGPRVAEILRQEPVGSFLRIGVDGGGCSGFSYTYGISMEQITGDLVLRRDGATVAIDPVSLDLLRGSKVDFVDGLMGRMFKIENPLATASCGCGSSFAV